MGESSQRNTSIVTDISGEGVPEITEIESLCMACEEQGMTRLFMTRIPFYREVIVSSFSCDHCGGSNSEVQPASRIHDQGVRFSVRVNSPKDISRQVVTTESTTIRVPELDLEIPPTKGSLTTIEGILGKAEEGLSQDQVLRKIQHPELAEKISQFVEKLTKLKTGNTPFTLELDDISGNSFVENPSAPSDDPNLTESRYTRTKQQDASLGIFPPEPEEVPDDPPDRLTQSLQNEVLSIDSQCPTCDAPCPLNMKVVDIPHFKEVVVMATTCDVCGYRSNEVKSGAGMSELGQNISLRIDSVEDLKRDILKSDTTTVKIPELEFETQSGTLGGKFTTVEGLLTDIRDSLMKVNPFGFGDSSDDRTKLVHFCSQLTQIIDGSMVDVHLVLDDPAGNSYIQNPLAPEPDPQLEVTNYKRSFEQNEELGLNDMKTENY